jgi:tetratricopeptide (TPR) repeat protein
LQQSERQGLPERAEVPAVPFFAQDEFYCGPAALAMTLAWSGLQVSQTDVAPMIYTPGREGTLQSDVITGARRYGRLAVPVNDLQSLLSEVAAGTPVLVLQNLALEWMPQWHYAVAVGYDLDASTLTLNSGRHERLVVPLATFERTWARSDYWALVVTPPNRLPVSASEGAAIVAASGLERTGHAEDAVLAYEAIVQRWPNSHIGWMALGNARFAVREYGRAEAAYRRAGDLKPHEPESWNNLAVAVAKQGRQAEAISFANRAIEVNRQQGGPHAGLFRQTRAEILQMEQAQVR